MTVISTGKSYGWGEKSQAWRRPPHSCSLCPYQSGLCGAPQSGLTSMESIAYANSVAGSSSRWLPTLSFFL